ncbi:phosphate regulon sensor histidine kinase PhoR [Oxalobacteraceae bacterium R-40]|uniref:histidine kinase n=1 Tax=Keguizhuia sedimenti TaxID=3064264 RepID=A0ABU1BPH8_9BURK|nr:phosphate regulon sensor histidine kinase PhoR [Oxalobacteraceae bacterium R-40]
MNSQATFWIPAVLRALLLLGAAGAVAYFWGLTAGLAAGLVFFIATSGLQLFYLYKLGLWLDKPESERMPDGWGGWTEIFARLYKLKRDDEKNQSELAEWLTRFRQAMSRLPDGVVIMDDVLFLEWCNPISEKHLGLSLERDKGMRVTNLIRHPDFIDYIILGRYEQPLNITLKGRKLVIHLIPFENRRQILVTHDQTELDRIDAMRRDFIANASHELRTPLTVINGFLEIALAQPELDAATRQDHVRLMAEQGKRMQNLIDDMLTLTRLESLDSPLRTEVVRIRPMLEQILQEAKALSSGKHNIVMDVDGPDMKGNTDEMRSAFTNLVSNAVRYTPEGGSIHISWINGENGPEFIVRDTGIGIDPEHLPRLTERFYRVDKSRSRETKGTGLGLAIVKHVLLRHGASLNIASKVGEGSQFKALFPAELAVHSVS